MTKIEINIRCVHSANWRAENVTVRDLAGRSLNGRRYAGIKRGMYDYYSAERISSFALREVTRRRSIWRWRNRALKRRESNYYVAETRSRGGGGAGGGGKEEEARKANNAKIIAWRSSY